MDRLSLAIDPRLGLDASTLAAAWNEAPELRAKAEAASIRTPPGGFIDPVLAQGLVSLAISVVGGLTTNLILDFIRARLKAEGKKDAAVEVEQRELPTGERLLIVRASGKGG
jgi:hypothetical protein